MSKKIDLLIKFGIKVKNQRLRQNLSQEELAEKVGVHRTYIGMIERGEKNITIRNMKKLSVALNIKLEDLVARL